MPYKQKFHQPNNHTTMNAELEQLDTEIASIQKKVQHFNNAYHVCRDHHVASHIEFYKRWLVRLLQIQCDLMNRRFMLQLNLVASTTQALDLMDVPYFVHNGNIYITE